MTGRRQPGALTGQYHYAQWPARNGQPAIAFTLRQVNEGFNAPDSNPVVRRCYGYNGANGSTIAPTIRIKPGDTLTLNIKNELPFAAGVNMPAWHRATPRMSTITGPIQPRVCPRTSILQPPSSRAEFIVPAPRAGMRGEFLALQYNTGIDQNTGDRNLQRTLATIQVVAKKNPLALETIEA